MKFNVVAMISLTFILGLSVAAFAGLGTDSDGDGVLDVNDNCSAVAQIAGVNDCDTDGDGYGNMCDGDFDNSFTVNSNDFGNYFAGDFATKIDSGVGTDHDCSGTVNSNDFGGTFAPQFSQKFPGPSGLACAGQPGCTP